MEAKLKLETTNSANEGKLMPHCFEQLNLSTLATLVVVVVFVVVVYFERITRKARARSSKFTVMASER